MNAFISSRRIPARRLAAVILALCVASTASALTVTQTLSFRIPGETGLTLNFAPFDASLGVLEGIDVTYTATQRHSWALWNGGSGPATVPFTGALGASVLTVGSESVIFGALNFGPGTSGTLTPVTPLEFGQEFAAGLAQFASGNTPGFPSAEVTHTTSLATGAFALPLGFTGDLALSFDAGSWTIAAANAFAASLVDVSGSVTATYRYRAIAVTDDLPVGGALASVLALLAGVHMGRHASARRPHRT